MRSRRQHSSQLGRSGKAQIEAIAEAPAANEGPATREETVNNIIRTLGTIQKSDGSPNSFNNLLTMLLADHNMQECLNVHRSKLGLSSIDFTTVQTLEDLKPFNISYDQLLDSLNTLKIEDADAESPDGKWSAYPEEQMLAQA